jgi:FixJ family two-component response regulator
VIALVDDDESMLRALRRLLTSAGYVSETYPSAVTFLQSGLRPDVRCLVADVQMPGMTGLDLLVHLAVAKVRLPIIIITAYSLDEEICLQTMQAGVVAYVYKPFEDYVLLEAIQRALPGHERS